MIELRPYQQDLLDGTLKLWSTGARRIAAVMATGGGKTVYFSHIARMAAQQGRPTLVLAHRTELVDQAIAKLQDVNPDMQIGRMQGNTKEWRADIVVGSVPTCATPGGLKLLSARRWGLIVVDETHHIVADTYLRILRELRAYDVDGPLTLGVTATLDRGDRRALGQVFEDVVEPRIGLIDLIKQGYLVRPRGIRVRIGELDLSRVRRTGGDFNAGQLGAAMTAAMAPQRLVDAWEEHAKGRPTLAFLPTVDVSRDQAEAFTAAGYRAVHLDAETHFEVRRATLEAFRAGKIDILCNVGLFTEGTDLPTVACVILGRPTSSTTLYQQMVGRGLRLAPGKRDCIILDVTGVTGRHKLATLVSLSGADNPEEIPDDLLLYEEDEYDVAADPEIPDADEASAIPTEYADGDLDHMMVDLFGESHSAWLRTDGGLWFLPTPQGFIYLTPAGDDRYDLRWHTGTDHGLIQEGMEIGYAMAAGDAYVAERPLWQVGRDASWRRDTDRAARYDTHSRRRASQLLDS